MCLEKYEGTEFKLRKKINQSHFTDRMSFPPSNPIAKISSNPEAYLIDLYQQIYKETSLNIKS